MALCKQVEQSTWRCDKHVYTAAEGLNLLMLRYASENNRMADVGVLSILTEIFAYLDRELARGRQDQGTYRP